MEDGRRWKEMKDGNGRNGERGKEKIGVKDGKGRE